MEMSCSCIPLLPQPERNTWDKEISEIVACSYTKLEASETMSTAIITPEGQILLGKEHLRHLGVHPGERVSMDLLPGGRIALGAPVTEAVPGLPEPTGRIEEFFGILKGKSSKVATLEEIQEAIEEGWAGI